MGVAFLPLLERKLIIRHIRMQHPNVWAIRLDKNRWNFSDLLQPGLEIRFVEVDDGTLHIRDRAEGLKALAPDDLSDLRLKLVIPKEKRRWPFFLDFRMPKSGYSTSVRLTGFGNGLLKNWGRENYKFDLTATNLNPRDLGPFYSVFPDIDGLYKLKVAGEGRLENGIRAVAQADIRHMQIKTQQLGTLKAANATSSAKLLLDPAKLEWQDLSLSFGNVEIHSKGKLSGWQHSKPVYEAALAGKVTDLSKISTYLPGSTRNSAGNRSSRAESQLSLAEMLEQRKLTGEAEFTVTLIGDERHPQLSTAIKARGLSASDLFADRPFKNIPWLAALFGRPSSKVNGEVKIGLDERIDLPSADISSDGQDIHVSGFWDKRKAATRFKFSGQNVDLNALVANLKTTREFCQFLTKSTGLGSANNLMIAGRVAVSGTVEGNGKSNDLNADIELKDVSLNIKGRNLSANHINGRLQWYRNSLKFNQVTGVLGKGRFQLSGSINGLDKPRCDISFQGQDMDLDHLNTALQMLKVQIPLLVKHQLYGQIKQLAMKMSGSPDNPTLSLNLIPQDLYYVAAGVNRPMHCTAGNITYEHDELILRDVALVTHNNQIITNLDIANLSSTADLRRVRLRTSGIDLADVHFYLSSALMPAALRKLYLNFVDTYHVAYARGKVYGNLWWQAKPQNEFDLDGVVGLYNTAIKVGSAGWPLEHLSGLFAASGEELLVQDFAGSVGGNSFALDGHIINYRRADARWQTELKAQVTPERALKLMPALASQFGSKVSTSGPLALRAILTGDSKTSTMVISLRSDPSDRLRIVTPFGVVAQPANQTITLDGSLTVESGKAGSIQLNNANLIVGSSLLQASGKYCWADAKSSQQPTLDCALKAPNPVLAQTVLDILYPTEKLTGVAGTLTGELSTAGPINHLTSRGHLQFDKLTLPQFNMHEVTGKVETPGWSFDGSDLRKSAESGSKTELHIDSAKFGLLETKDLDASLVFETTNSDNRPSQRVVLHDGRAQVAGGEIKLGGWADLNHHRFHLQSDVRKVQANQVVGQLLGYPGEISGWADASLLLDSEGIDYKQMMSNLDGEARLSITSGKVARVGQLQEKITQANLLQSGLLGFNFNNLVQSVMPVRTGEFKDLEALIDIKKGALKIQQLKFNGDDMRLRAAGEINPEARTIKLNVAGNIPRVATSVLGGAVGEVSRGFTIQKMMSLLTMHKLESLPSLPILGEIADDRPRAFTFHVAAELDKPNLIAQSIQKSFHWLPSQPNASAHPLLGDSSSIR